MGLSENLVEGMAISPTLAANDQKVSCNLTAFARQEVRRLERLDTTCIIKIETIARSETIGIGS